MGPLVPDIISQNLNLVAALLIGIAFGAILEQAGFSSSRRLVGLFYGYDFTVLRVFFTAGVTAMAGIILLEHFGLIDINLVYINPLYLQSAIVGGLIMGLGFVIGGYCPGTSVCAAAIGKTD
ncbi:MAG: YeeE/YedE thiosulfate transporter family protein, partial [Bacteroidota bacterium]|nr:YeeE/YedE thiosulfate transporter family protein [Bacteroidota bacterium]